MLNLYDKASSLILANITIDKFDELDEVEVRHFDATRLDVCFFGGGGEHFRVSSFYFLFHLPLLISKYCHSVNMC